ncbi:MAG: hypothetical protein ACOZE5_17115 [Verrucomicrobiota bacterium]
MKSPPNLTKRLILFPQDKGGIGKSFVATLLYDYLREHEVELKTFDLDSANSTFKRYVPAAEFINTDVDASKLGVLDQLVSAFDTADTVLADNRAAGGRKILRYIDDTRLTEAQTEARFTLVFVVIAVDDKDANSQIAEIVDTYAGRVRWLLVRNYRDGGNLALFEQSNARKKLAELGAVEVNLPSLVEVTRNRLQQANLTVGMGRTAPKLPVLDRSRCLKYHADDATEFAKAGDLLLG